jgi:DNA polymerase-3 subunit delta'
LYNQSRELLTLMNRLGEHPGLNPELLIMDWLFNFNEETCL